MKMENAVSTIVFLLVMNCLLNNGNALICLYGSFCKADSDCVIGTRCYVQSISSSQCVLNTTYARITQCIPVYSQCGGQSLNSSSSCCTGYCSRFNQCVPYLPPQCIFPLQPLTNYPTPSPTTRLPSVKSSIIPSRKTDSTSTKLPTFKPSLIPSLIPTTDIPTGEPTTSPTFLRTRNPTNFPVARKPSSAPTRRPTMRPSKFPTAAPVPNPTEEPSLIPTQNPTESPSIAPTKLPTAKPSNTPRRKPTKRPTRRPTRIPSKTPLSVRPTTPTISPKGDPTSEPSFRPKLYITIGQHSGDTLNIAEVWFYSQGRRLPSNLFKASATSFYGTFLGPIKDPLGDTFGGPALVNDGNLETATRTRNAAYNPYVPIYLPENIPRIILTTDKGTHFDQIVVYNRRLPKAQSRLANAFINVLLYYPLDNVTLWRSNFIGTKYMYNFTNVNSGNTARPSVAPTTGPSQPTAEPTADPTIYYYLAPPVPGQGPAKLVITISQSNGNPLMISEVGFQLGTRAKDPKGSLLLDSTTKKLPSILNGTYSNGAELNVIDNDPHTFFWSLDSTTDDDANPTLILYENSESTGFVFDTIMVYNVAYKPMQKNLAGAKINVFYYSPVDKSRTYIWNATLSGVQSMYKFTNIPIPGANSKLKRQAPTAKPSVAATLLADDDNTLAAATTTASITGYY